MPFKFTEMAVQEKTKNFCVVLTGRISFGSLPTAHMEQPMLLTTKCIIVISMKSVQLVLKYESSIFLIYNIVQNLQCFTLTCLAESFACTWLHMFQVEVKRSRIFRNVL